MADDHPEYRTRKEIAARLGISQSILCRWMREAGIKPSLIENRPCFNVYLYDPEAVRKIEALKEGHSPRGKWTRKQKENHK